MRSYAAVAGACVVVTMAAGCSGTRDQGGSAGAVVDGATFTLAVSADPGNLDPQGSVTSNVFEMSQFAYDHLLNADSAGKISSGLATEWKVDGTKVTLTMRKGVTCSDGAPFTPADAAANVNYVADPKNKSPFLGVLLPYGAHATVDDQAGTVTVAAPDAPFVLTGLGNLPMVCAAGMKDRKTLARQTNGTGPYQLKLAEPGNQYTYTRRAGYSWGPGGASTSTPGLPAEVVVKVIANETTAANLLLSGGLNAATVRGPDAQRLTAAHLYSSDQNNLLGEMWFNQSKGRVTAEQPIRLALTKALDLSQLAKVITSGRGGPATTLAADPPVACPGKSVPDALPAHDLAAAGQLLDQAGWTAGPDGIRAKNGKSLSVTFVHDTAGGPAGSAAAELAVAGWKQLGVQVTVKPQDQTAIGSTLFSTGDWDISWEPVGVGSPDQLRPFLSGAVPPNGTNFASINNADYQAGAAKAATKPGSAGCSDWLAAETHLVSAADVIPFANQTVKTFGNGARFDQAMTLIPMSIRMVAR
ncbi:ABC transporter substrate-binding protein [Actinoplanes sp. NPDC049265]|uniref:ABC transporter substrate-binding protein n=1 Tax=Actinoplanes sp. NPDC049265 TaxID=3363902 RepID=UPI003713A460